MARSLLAPGEFIEVFVNTPLEVCISRDPKGLYGKALAGRITGFTGVDAPYERPEAPDLHLETGTETVERLVDRVLEHLTAHGILDHPA